MSKTGSGDGGNNVQRVESLFRRGLPQIGMALPDEIVARLAQYAQELVKWNRRINLVAKNTSLADIVEKHFLDSLTLVSVLAVIAPEKGMLLDVGSGAGFPGLVIKTVCPDRPVTLLEPRQRRVSFLNHVVRLLGLEGISVLPRRTDEKEALPHVRYEVITSRAVADVESFLDMVQDLAAPGTLVVCMQGASGRQQWERVRDRPHYSPVNIEEIRLPFSGDRRTILVFRKK